MKQIKITTCSISRFGRRDADYTAIALETVRDILSRTDVGRIGGIYVASYAPTELCGISDPIDQMRRSIIAEFPDLRCEFHGLYKTGAAALYEALGAMGAGTAGDLLVVGSEKMTHVDPARVSGLLSARENSHERAYGATLPALGALVTRAYMRKHNIPEGALHDVAVKNHRHGALNPNAHFQRAVTEAEVAASPLVADPLRRLHCAPISDGAAALLLSPSDGDVRLVGCGKGTDRRLFQERADISRFVATAQASRMALASGNITNREVDVVEVHDAFTSFELINLEEMGFCVPGSAWKALVRGDLDIGGRLAVNPSGGMKAKGHPIGASGLSSCVEIFEQLMARAGGRQHAGARVGMVQSVGGVSDESYAFVMEVD